MGKRLLVLANQIPFIRGGAESHVANLVAALRDEGHEVDIVSIPFKFEPDSHHEWMMKAVEQLDLHMFSGYGVDGVISMVYPMWGARHSRHVSWIIHQHRAVYDLMDLQVQREAFSALRASIAAYDTQHLGSKAAVFANSRNVASRLKRFNGLESRVLYHPPPDADRLHAGEALPYIFCPSRIEPLKRQSLLVEAARLLKTPMNIIFAGGGSQSESLKNLIADWGLQDRVTFLGHISDAEKIALYARCSAVFFGPRDEDLGYVTLEAMCASKPVITCNDSGGPLEFVTHGETGWVVPADAQAVASVIDGIAVSAAQVAAMGRAGRVRYENLKVSWSNVTRQLLGALFPEEYDAAEDATSQQDDGATTSTTPVAGGASA